MWKAYEDAQTIGEKEEVLRACLRDRKTHWSSDWFRRAMTERGTWNRALRKLGIFA